jgi:hypothetical protein
MSHIITTQDHEAVIPGIGSLSLDYDQKTATLSLVAHYSDDPERYPLLVLTDEEIKSSPSFALARLVRSTARWISDHNPNHQEK